MYAERAKQIFAQEIQELEKLQNSIDANFDHVVEVLYHCQGKVVMMGIGKTGIIAHKMAASFASPPELASHTLQSPLLVTSFSATSGPGSV